MPSKRSLKDSGSPITPKKKRKKLSQRRLEMLLTKNQDQNTSLENSDSTMNNTSDLRMEKDKKALLLWVYLLFLYH